MHILFRKFQHFSITSFFVLADALLLTRIRPPRTNYPKASASCKLHISNTNSRHFSSYSVVTLQTDCFHYSVILVLLCPRPVGGGALSGHRRPSSVCLSVCLMLRTSALTRKPKGLGRRNFAQGYPRSHATPTPTSRSKGQKSRSRGGGILWRPPSRTAC